MVPAEDLEAVKNELLNHTELTLKEPGCITFKVKQCDKDPCRFDVYEEFIDKTSFEVHQVRTKSSAWAMVSANVKRYYEIEE